MNNCTLQGRISGVPQQRELPSGDVVVAFRLVVPRADSTRVDTIDCAVTSVRLRRLVLKLEPGSEVTVEGELHRRFWRSAQGVASRYEVQAEVVRRVT